MNDKKYRLLLRIRDKSRPIIQQEDGQKIIPTMWIEHEEVYNFGSIKNPSDKGIFEFKLEPIFNPFELFD